MGRRASLRIIGTFALAISAVVIAAAPAAAISEVESSGNVGVVTAFDDQNQPGAKCTYNAQFRLANISIRQPNVYSYRQQGQQVGWRFIIVHRHLIPNNDQYTEETVFKSKWVRAFAEIDNAAHFTRRTWVRDIHMVPSSRFKVYVAIKWFKPSDNSVEGRYQYRYDWFRQVGPSLDTIGQDFYCYRAPF